MIRRRHKRRRETEGEINITAFLNLMVVLIPFLLITAVFSQMSVLELFLPPNTDSADNNDKPSLILELIIRKDKIEIGDRNQGLLKSIPKSGDLHDFNQAHDFLKSIKEKFPNVLEITILLEKDIQYEVLIKAMDSSRLMDTVINGQDIKTELFPNISIGSAPVLIDNNATNQNNGAA